MKLLRVALLHQSRSRYLHTALLQMERELMKECRTKLVPFSPRREVGYLQAPTWSEGELQLASFAN